MVAAPPAPRPWPEAARTALLLVAAELLITRLSSGERVAGAAMVAAGVGWLLLVLVPTGLVALLPLPPRARRVALGGVGAGAATVLGLGLVGPALAERFGGGVAVVGGALLGAPLLLLGRRFPSPTPFPSPAALVLHLALLVALAWAVGPGEVPPAGLVGGLSLAGLALVPLGATPRRAALAAGLASLLAAVPGRAGAVRWADRPAAAGPDLVLLTVDTLRADAVDGMAAATRLAAEGTRFVQAEAPAPWTLPSVATLLTGRAPAAHRALAHADGRYAGVDPAVPTVAEALAAAGWDTVGVAAPNPFVGPSFGLDRGFDHFHQPGWSRHALPRGLQNLAACPLPARVTEKLAHVLLCHPVDGAGVTDHVVDVLAQRRDRPLFLWVHWLDVHLPYAHTADPAVSADLRRVLTGDFHRGVAARRDRPGLPAELAAAYRDEVAFVDGQLLRVLDALGPPPARGRVVVLTSDHGEERFEHGGFEHGHTLYEELLHVPLVVSGLGTPAVVDVPVALVDVPATLLAAAGVGSPAPDGVDLAGPLAPDRPLRAGNLLRLAPDQLRAVRRGDWKLVEDAAGRVALYDLRADPGETRDRAPDEPGRVIALRALLADAPGPEGDAVAVDAAQRERLEALGYGEGIGGE